MAQYNHTCKVCGAGYNACDTCLNTREYAAWRAIGCCADHFKAFMVIYEYDNGTLKKDEAKAMLGQVVIEGWESYPDPNNRIIAEILKEDATPLQAPENPAIAVQIPAKETATQDSIRPAKTVQQASAANKNQYKPWKK